MIAAVITSAQVGNAPVIHEHRRPNKSDFEGKTVKRFVRQADNIWQFYFTDGTSFAIQSDLHFGLAVMELCEVCSLDQH